jgi:hypothetical protein
MARTTAANFSGGLQFPYATAATDIFKKEDVQTLALAVDQHDHSSGKGLLLSASGIPAGSITSAMIADGTIQTVDLQDGSVSTIKLQDLSVTTAKLAANSVDTSKIVDGTITTADLAAGAVTNLVGSYNASPTFSTSGTGAWSNTPISVVGGFGGQRALVTFVTMFAHTVANAQFYTALYLDAAAACAILHTAPSLANGILVVSYSIIITPAAGGHSVILYINNNTAGTLSISTASSSQMSVVEDKR